MGKKLYAGGISFNAADDDLADLFSQIGEVESVKIIMDATTGKSKGFAFIEMVNEEDAERAITELNGSSFMERTIVVNEARPRQKREQRRFGRGKGGYDSRGRNSGSGFGNKGRGPGRRGRR